MTTLTLRCGVDEAKRATAVEQGPVGRPGGFFL
jgi:hypothetical protein